VFFKLKSRVLSKSLASLRKENRGRNPNPHLPCNIVFKNTINRAETAKAALEAKVFFFPSGIKFLETVLSGANQADTTDLTLLSFRCTRSL